MSSEYALIISTCGDMESANMIARILVEMRLAACVQMFPIGSVYLWQGEICEDKEVALFIKSKATMFDRVAAVIKENHQYDIPEIVQLPITGGLPDYLRWVDECVGE